MKLSFNFEQNFVVQFTPFIQYLSAFAFIRSDVQLKHEKTREASCSISGTMIASARLEGLIWMSSLSRVSGGGAKLHEKGVSMRGDTDRGGE